MKNPRTHYPFDIATKYYINRMKTGVFRAPLISMAVLTLTACASKPPTEPPVRVVERLVTLKCPIPTDLMTCAQRPGKPDTASMTDEGAGVLIIDLNAAWFDCYAKLGKVREQLAGCERPE